MKTISVHRLRRQSGNVIIEFALVTPFLMLLLAGGFTLGMALNRSIQCSNVCRNANVLQVRGIDLSTTQNQSMLLRTAQGLGFTTPGTNTADPNGKGVIILTRVIKVGSNQCNLGIPGWNGLPSSCPNFGQYVITKRNVIGNGSRWSSVAGNPSSTLQADGSISDYNVCMISANRATGFPGVVTLSDDEFTLLAEVYADISDLNFFNWFSAPIISVRNIS